MQQIGYRTPQPPVDMIVEQGLGHDIKETASSDCAVDGGVGRHLVGQSAAQESRQRVPVTASLLAKIRLLRGQVPSDPNYKVGDLLVFTRINKESLRT